MNDAIHNNCHVHLGILRYIDNERTFKNSILVSRNVNKCFSVKLYITKVQMHSVAVANIFAIDSGLNYL